MTNHAEPAARAGEAPFGLLSRTFVRRYGVAVICALSGLLLARLIVAYADAPLYSLLLGAVVVSVFYGGVGPGLVTTAIAWTVAPFMLVPPGTQAGINSRNELWRWAIPLAVALMVIWINLLVRRTQERAATAVVVAEASTRQMESLQGLATALSVAVTHEDVAQTLIERAPPLIGARGGAIGLLDGEELVIDRSFVPLQTHQPGVRFPLRMRAPIVRAAATNQAIVVRSRTELTTRFPDAAARSSFAHAAIALPLRTAGDVVGAISFLYDRDTDLDEDTIAMATIAVDLGGQALERAFLYERERQSRQALDRILRVAPRLSSDSPEHAGAAICREARVTFGSDYAEIWRVERGQVELLWREPHEETLRPLPEAPLALDRLPGLRNAIEKLEVTFVSDADALLQGALRQYVRELGGRSWLWIPIVVGGTAERALLVSWHGVVTEPDGSSVLLARRFADQAGLALEQIDRREAQAQAARRAERARRLQLVTAALSQAATPGAVTDACLEHAMAAVGADAGMIAFLRPGTDDVEVVSARGYADESLERGKLFPLGADVPLTRSMTTREPIWALADAGVRSVPLPTVPHENFRGWLAVPLTIGTGVRGAIQLVFRQPREVSQEDRDWLLALASQCAQAFERARLFEEERRLRRRSERLQSMTASLSGSVTQRDVGSVAVSEIVEAVDASAGAVAVVAEDGRELMLLAAIGYDLDDARGFLELELEASTPATRTLRRRIARHYETLAEVAEESPEAVDDLARTGHASFLFLPLVVGGETEGVLVTSWAEETPLTAGERSFVQTLAHQAAQALERARHFESERTIAETLQRSVLPVSLPEIDGVRLAARYLPGTMEVDVGGDWFDALSLPSGRLGLVVGDVVGKGVRSAATMAQLRNALRAFALDQMKPSSTVARLNRLMEEVEESSFATLVYLVVDPETRVCRFTSAGHPPPLVVYPDGRAEYLEGGRGLPLGTSAEPEYTQQVIEVPPGSTLLLYSDGLIERRDQTIDEGLAHLREAAASGPHDPERLVEHVLHELVGASDRRDDIALLATRLLVAAPNPLRLELPSSTGSLNVVRDALRVWLESASLRRPDADDVVLATWEACANAVEHAMAPTEDTFVVAAEVEDGVVRVSICDTGGWSPEQIRGNRGLGLQLMRSLMSSVEVEPGPRGTKVVLEKAHGPVATVN